ncbi:hypothetical protein HanIR_Chr11g0528191 [Helianthus annuus]|nr:hypothetical protein HanIR_Chr11g0528191 [Helianthus annuus]
MPLRQKRMPPRRDTNTSTLPRIEAELRKRISQAIARHEAIRFKHSDDTTGNNPPTDCTYKQFLNCKPLNFDRTGGAVAFVRWSEKIDSILRMTNCSPQQSVTFTSGSFLDGTLSWWDHQVQALGTDAAYALSWDELKEMIEKRCCSRTGIQKLKVEFWNLKMDEPRIPEYVQ